MVGIIIITFNIPTEVFLLQVAAIEKFCDDDFEINVVDNSNDEERCEAIRYHSERLGLKYIKTFSESIGSISHAFAANFIYARIMRVYSHFLFLDHDCIPVKPFSVEGILGNKIMAGIGQQKSKLYFWPGCLMWNNDKVMKSLIDFSTNSKLGLDTGGNLYQVIEEYGEKKCIFFNETYHENPAFTEPPYNFYAMINDGMFIHFINGSGWNGKSEERINSLLNITKQITKL